MNPIIKGSRTDNIQTPRGNALHILFGFKEGGAYQGISLKYLENE